MSRNPVVVRTVPAIAEGLEKLRAQLVLGGAGQLAAQAKDVRGVAYEVDVPMSTFYNLPAGGVEVTLFTHLVVREDAHQLRVIGVDDGAGRAARRSGLGLP